MKLMTLPQYMKMSKPALIRKITKTLRAMPKKRLARLCYEITKSKLPRISIRERKFRMKYTYPKGRPELEGKRIKRKTKRKFKQIRIKTPAGGTRLIMREKRKTKRKFSRKQLAAQRLFAKRARAGTLRKRRC